MRLWSLPITLLETPSGEIVFPIWASRPFLSRDISPGVKLTPNYFAGLVEPYQCKLG
jgi:hypothetical protein